MDLHNLPPTSSPTPRTPSHLDEAAPASDQHDLDLIGCPCCDQRTRRGLACEWCGSPLPRPDRPLRNDAGAAAAAVAEDSAVALALLDARRATLSDRFGMRHRNRVIAKMGMGAAALVIASVFGFSRANYRRPAGKPLTSRIVLELNGQSVTFDSAYAYAALEGTPRGSLSILAGDVDPYLSLNLPAEAPSISRLAGQTLHSVMSNRWQSANEGSDILYFNERRYVPERVSATVQKASNREVTLALDGSFREEGQAGGQNPPSLPLRGTITLKVATR